MVQFVKGMKIMNKSKTTGERIVLFICDNCGDVMPGKGVAPDFTLPAGWESFSLDGWIGEFHTCCCDCKNVIFSCDKMDIEKH